MASSMVGEGMMYGTYEVVFVGALGVHGQQFADLDTGNIGLDGIEFSAMRVRRIGFHVIGFHMGWPTWQPYEAHGGVLFGLAIRCGEGSRLEQAT